MAANSPFGHVVSAMVTPFTDDGELDLPAAGKLATWLVDNGHDGLVVSGTTGESATTSDDEKDALLRTVIDAVGDRATITAGVPSNDTAHCVRLAERAQAAGADGALVVTPYYNKPPQEGIVAHVLAIADACELSILLYDIPGRTGMPMSEQTLLTLGKHPRIRGVKDAKADYWQASRIMTESELLWFSGDDGANLLHYANGAIGFVGVTSQVAPELYAQMGAAAAAGDIAGVRQIHRRVAPLVDAVMGITQGAIMAKAGLKARGILASDFVRMPLISATPEQTSAVDSALAAVLAD